MKVLIVVDMLNDFVDKTGVLNFEAARDIIPFIKKRINEYRKTGNYIIFLQDWHKKNDKEFERHPEHALEDTWGAEIIPGLNIDYKMQTIIKKQRYSGFYGTNLEDQLKSLKILYGPIELVEVIGVCTSICVMDTVGGLVNRDYNVVIPEAGVADFDFNEHHNAIGRMENLYGAKIV